MEGKDALSDVMYQITLSKVITYVWLKVLDYNYHLELNFILNVSILNSPIFCSSKAIFLLNQYYRIHF